MSTPAASSVLQDILRIPIDFRPGAPLIVLLHGRGADKEDLASLSEFLPEGAAAAFPRAPFPAAPWGYGPGFAWYRFLGGARPEPESFSEGQAALDRYLAALPARLPHRHGPIVLGGFSQGGTSALAWALAHAGRVAGVLMLSGFLAEHPSVRVSAETAKGLEVFWGHGTLDPSIPFALGEHGRTALRAAGAGVAAHDYPSGHTIVREEMEDARAWLNSRLQAR
jgi:phospholipase/carboxylesterase